MSSNVEQIKQRLSIVELVGSYLKLERAGVNYKARCPFHTEKTASFFVSPARDSFHCFGCGKGGDIFSFVEEMEGLSFPEALKMLAERAGVTLTTGPAENTGKRERERGRHALSEALLFYQSSLSNAETTKKYLFERGVSGESIEKFKLGFAPAGWRNIVSALSGKGITADDLLAAGLLVKTEKGTYDRFRNRIMFPTFDYNSQIVGFSARVLPGTPESEQTGGKYINTPQTILYNKSKIFYGIELAKNLIREKGEAVLVEGNLDVILSHQAGITNTIGISGTALTLEHTRLIARMADTLTIILDGDEAGFRASGKSVGIALKEGLLVKVVSLPPDKDPADIVRESPKKWQELLKNAKPFVDYVLEMVGRDKKDARKISESLVEHLFPYLVLVPSRIERDGALKKVADTFAFSIEALRGDFEKWEKSHDGLQEVSPKEADKNKDKPDTLRERLEKQILGILFWQKKSAEPIVVISELASRFRALVGSFNRPLSLLDVLESEGGLRREDESAEQSLAFLAESYYGGANNLEQEMTNLFSRLEKEYLREDLDKSMEELRRAEAKGDASRIEELLKHCQIISHKLSLTKS